MARPPRTGQRGDLHEAAPQCGHRRGYQATTRGRLVPRRVTAAAPVTASSVTRTAERPRPVPPQPPRLRAGALLPAKPQRSRPGTRIPRSRPPRPSAARPAGRPQPQAGPLGRRPGEDAPGGVEDLRRPWPGPARSRSRDLVCDLDHTAGVDHVVRRVEHAAVGQDLLHAGVGQLVVGGAADHRAVSVARSRRPARRRARTARTRPAACGPGPRRRRRCRPAGAWRVPRRPRPRDVGDHDLGAVVDQVVDQVPADLADAGDADPAAGQRRRAPLVLGAARMPWNTPNAVSTDESPAPPSRRDRPVTNRVSRATTSMSAT